MQYYKDDTATITYEQSLDMAVIAWHVKFITHAQYLTTNEALLKLILDKQCTRLICDTTNMGVLPLESQAWTTNVLTHKYLQSNLQFTAIITSKDVFNKVAMNNIVRKTNNTQYHNTFFASYPEALAWIKAQKIQQTVA